MNTAQHTNQPFQLMTQNSPKAMTIEGPILIGANLLTWWLVFWLPLKKDNPLRFLVFIPAAVCALGVPIMIDDKRMFDEHKGLSTETHCLLQIAWLLLPIALVALEVAWKFYSRKNPVK
jgi:hypothetical protein